MKSREFKVIARIKTDFPDKFGTPRQSGLADGVLGKIIFEPEYRNDDALRGIEGYSHLWLLWEFSKSVCEKWSPTVRPPRLGGNKRMGIFATRSPFRPNPIGLSSVKLEKVEHTAYFGTVLIVSGVDIINDTPIYDIKPYIAYTDSHPDAVSGFADDVYGNDLSVEIPREIKEKLDSEFTKTLIKILSNDPRPSYQNDKERIYSFEFAEYNIKFKVDDKILTVIDVNKILY